MKNYLGFSDDHEPKTVNLKSEEPWPTRRGASWIVWGALVGASILVGGLYFYIKTTGKL